MVSVSLFRPLLLEEPEARHIVWPTLMVGGKVRRNGRLGGCGVSSARGGDLV